MSIEICGEIQYGPFNAVGKFDPDRPCVPDFFKKTVDEKDARIQELESALLDVSQRLYDSGGCNAEAIENAERLLGVKFTL